MSANLLLEPSESSWSTLSDVLHEFSRVCYIDEVNADLLILFTKVTNIQDAFLRRARLIFNNLDLSIHGADFQSPQSLARAAQRLISDWKLFAACFIDVTVTGVAPLYPLLTARIFSLARLLGRLSNLFIAPQPLVPIGDVRHIKTVIDDLKAHTLSLADDSRRPIGACDPTAFREQLRTLSDDCDRVCLVVISKKSWTVAGLEKTKRRIRTANDHILNIAQGIAAFERLSDRSAGAILTANDCLNGLFASLNLRERVGTAQKKIEKEEAEEGEEKPETGESGPVGNVERLKSMIAGVEEVLASRAALYRKTR
jgi:hypothetical protein